MRETRDLPIERHKMLEIHGLLAVARTFGWPKAIWGFDIWFEGVPIIKAMIAANILVWIVFWLTSRSKP